MEAAVSCVGDSCKYKAEKVEEKKKKFENKKEIFTYI